MRRVKLKKIIIIFMLSAIYFYSFSNDVAFDYDEVNKLIDLVQSLYTQPETHKNIASQLTQLRFRDQRFQPILTEFAEQISSGTVTHNVLDDVRTYINIFQSQLGRKTINTFDKSGIVWNPGKLTEEQSDFLLDLWAKVESGQPPSITAIITEIQKNLPANLFVGQNPIRGIEILKEDLTDIIAQENKNMAQQAQAVTQLRDFDSYIVNMKDLKARLDIIDNFVSSYGIQEPQFPKPPLDVPFQKLRNFGLEYELNLKENLLNKTFVDLKDKLQEINSELDAITNNKQQDLANLKKLFDQFNTLKAKMMDSYKDITTLFKYDPRLEQTFQRDFSTGPNIDVRKYMESTMGITWGSAPPTKVAKKGPGIQIKSIPDQLEDELNNFLNKTTRLSELQKEGPLDRLIRRFKSWWNDEDFDTVDSVKDQIDTHKTNIGIIKTGINSGDITNRPTEGGETSAPGEVEYHYEAPIDTPVDAPVW
ncbi:hypothetical protein A3F66_01870 [candidate division TM6 bacterium RIFCSPHIGHO2_12_FULL_32_22]|nr:MAG: hypothetical protein A3F66_01870 [candidate division TM6 bacterium RIFCSPHIGHO2_12_FULL_32_22]